MIKTVLFLSLLALPVVLLSQEKSIPEEYCLSNEEYRLFTLIDTLRVSNELPPLQLSVSLSFVAKTHVRDLHDNNPDTSICNMNSWSDKGNWTACCHNKYLPDPACIVEKPSELTDYKEEGHELAYWEFGNAHPDSVFKLWTELEQTRSFILEKDKWETYEWKAIGVGIYNGYASIWVGEKSDKDGSPPFCDTNRTIKVNTGKSPSGIPLVETKQNRYYLIYGSLPNVEGAEQEARRYIKKGFPNVKIIAKGNKNFRISLNDFSSLANAKKGKNILGEKYKNAWILQY